MYVLYIYFKIPVGSAYNEFSGRKYIRQPVDTRTLAYRSMRP